ncbi:MAG: type II secretion system protein N [Candidatus Binataceae bacterium]
MRLTQRNIMAINILLGVALAYAAWVCILDIRGFSQPAEIAKGAHAHTALHAAAGPRTRAVYQEIVRRDIFNLVPPPAAAPPVETEDLHLTLIGTSHLTEAQPYAILASGNTQALYRLGDKVPKAAPVGTLVKVERSQVIIDHDGHRVALALPRGERPGATPSGLHPTAVQRPIPVRNRRGFDRRRHRFSPNGREAGHEERNRFNMQRLGPGQFNMNRNQVNSALANPADLLREIHGTPQIVDGKTTGYQVDSVVPGSIFDRLGLQGGDTITAFDGTPITSPQQGMTFLQSIPSRSAISVTVSRNGASIPLHLNLR